MNRQQSSCAVIAVASILPTRNAGFADPWPGHCGVRWIGSGIGCAITRAGRTQMKPGIRTMIKSMPNKRQLQWRRASSTYRRNRRGEYLAAGLNSRGKPRKYTLHPEITGAKKPKRWKSMMRKRLRRAQLAGMGLTSRGTPKPVKELTPMQRLYLELQQEIDRPVNVEDVDYRPAIYK